MVNETYRRQKYYLYHTAHNKYKITISALIIKQNIHKYANKNYIQ